jgi:hypothetical protein
LYGEGEPPLVTETSFSDVLVGYWRCGDYDTYPTLTDRSMNGNDGTMTSMAATDIRVGIEPYRSQWSIRGYDDITRNSPIYTSDVYNFEYTDSFSLAVWAAPFSGGILIGKQQSGYPYRGYVLGVTGNKVLTEINSTVSSNWIRRVSSSDVFDGDWKHVVLTWTGSATPSASDAKIYINGSEVSLTTEQNSLSATIISTARFALFARDGGWYCDAFIAEAMVWDTDLSAAQVSALYNGGTPIDPRVLDSSPNLKSWWPMGDRDFDVINGRKLQGRPTVDIISGYDSTYSSADNYWENKAPAYFGSMDGEATTLELDYADILHSKDGCLLEVGADEMPSAPRLYYRMRGWNITLGDWETWFAEDEPDPTPPVGPCINVTATAFWEYI